MKVGRTKSVAGDGKEGGRVLSRVGEKYWRFETMEAGCGDWALGSLVYSLFNMGGQEKNFKLSTVRSKAFETKTLCTNIEFHVHFIYLKRAIRGETQG